MQLPPSPSLWNVMTLPFPTPPTKQDPNGNYLPFPNITIVCHLNLSQEEGFSHFTNLPQYLEKISRGHTAPLPSSSYHATLLAGPRRDKKGKGGGEEWEGVLGRGEIWGGMAEYLGRMGFCPGRLKVGKVVVRKNGGVSVDLVGEGRGGGGEGGRYAGDNETRGLRKELRRIGRGEMERWERPWHITLGYGRGKKGGIPPEVESEVVKVVKEWFERGYENRRKREIPFQTAQLCLSPSMESFVPWNGGLPREEGEGREGRGAEEKKREENIEGQKSEGETKGEKEKEKEKEKEEKEGRRTRGRGRGGQRQKPRLQHLGP